MSQNPTTDRSIFLEAIEIAAPSDREAFVARACGGDSQLRSAVDALLAAHGQAGDLLDAPDRLARTTEKSVSERPGMQIGPYKLLQQIGEGGFGIVFMAEQIEPVRRRVALKVIKPGMDTRQVIARFEAERQALALMDYPNIAKVLDAGATESGRPYFVMELVRGTPIIQYCDENNLPVRERLGLFASVCQAIQHAHTKGIIHRDIKPTNVLVTRQDGQPVVKVIDFGIAKALGQQLTDKTLFTDFAQMIGTPLYMSPEQAELSSNDIDTRSDIYALGVLLYELLTGSTPISKEQLKQAAFDEIRRIIREDEPPKPSTRISTAEAAPSIAAQRQTEPARLARLVRGELDWIVMKALEKDRNRRYETATGFARDIEHYLNDEPVIACPPSAAYRLRKFVQRNRGGVVVSALLLAFLLLLGSGVGWTVRDRAARLARSEEQARRILNNEVATLIAQERWPEAEAAVEKAEATLAGNDQALPAELSDCVKQSKRQIQSGQQDQALADRFERLRARPPRFDEDSKLFYEYDAFLGYHETFKENGIILGQTDAAQAIAWIARKPESVRSIVIAALDDWMCQERSEVATGQRLTWLANVLSESDPDPWRNQVRAALVRGNLAALKRLAEHEQALEQPPSSICILAKALHQQGDEATAVGLLEVAQANAPDDFWLSFELAQIHSRAEPPRSQEAEKYRRAALAAQPLNVPAHLELSRDLILQGKQEQALAAHRRAIAIEPRNTAAHFYYGTILLGLGKHEEAAEAFRCATQLDPNNFAVHSHRALALGKAGLADEANFEFKEAVRLRPGYFSTSFPLGHVFVAQEKLEEAEAIWRETLRSNPSAAAAVHYQLAQLRTRQGRISEAEAEYENALRNNPEMGAARTNLRILRRDRELAAEEDKCREAIRQMPMDAQARLRLAKALLSQRRLLEAIPAFEEALRLKPDLRTQAYSDLGDCYARTGRWDKALAELSRTLDNPRPSPMQGASAAAALRLLTGDVAGYRRACGDLLKAWSEFDSPDIAWRVATVCLLSTDAPTDLDQVQQMLNRPVNKNSSVFHDLLVVRALASCRAGQHAHAIEAVKELPPRNYKDAADAVACAVRALGHIGLGERDQARSALAAGRSIVVNGMAGRSEGLPEFGYLDGWLHWQILSREAERLLEEPSSKEAQEPTVSKATK
jgi:serine/threonine protein kinase/Flp pilus assembly protein TadD